MYRVAGAQRFAAVASVIVRYAGSQQAHFSERHGGCAGFFSECGSAWVVFATVVTDATRIVRFIRMGVRAGGAVPLIE